MGKTLPSISLGDIDLIDGTQAGESDFIQVSVEFLSAADAAYGNGVLQLSPATTRHTRRWRRGDQRSRRQHAGLPGQADVQAR